MDAAEGTTMKQMSLEERRQARQLRILQNAEDRFKRITKALVSERAERQVENCGTLFHSLINESLKQSTDPDENITPAPTELHDHFDKFEREAIRQRRVSKEQNAAPSPKSGNISQAGIDEISGAFLDTADIAKESLKLERRKRLYRFLIIVTLAMTIRGINFMLEYFEAPWYFDRFFLPLIAFLVGELLVFPSKVKICQKLRLGITLSGLNERKVLVVVKTLTRIIFLVRDFTAYFFVYVIFGMVITYFFDM